ncbi:universal stress protein [Cuniculiplasma sp. SKW3]|uniref:universal stress protein n=1 Tax=unclassified Cuniculiplasma TaxID=2619706 RepID=UPI003FD572A0
MIDQQTSYLAKTDRILVPMAKGESSKKAFTIATQFARVLGSQITALTIKEETKEVTWSQKVAIIMNAYKEAKSEGLNVIPKIQSSKSIKEGIISEVNSRNYDLVLMSSRARPGISTSLLGPIGDYVIKNSKNTVAAVSLKRDTFPYKNIFVPMSERLNTRKSVYLSAIFAKVLGAKFSLCDMTDFDKKKIHGFKTIMNNEIWKELNLDYEITKLSGENLRESVMNRLYASSSDLIILGLRPDPYSNVRINSDIKRIMKDIPIDSILIKR